MSTTRLKKDFLIFLSSKTFTAAQWFNFFQSMIKEKNFPKENQRKEGVEKSQEKILGSSSWLKNLLLEALGWTKTQWFLEAEKPLTAAHNNLLQYAYCRLKKLHPQDERWKAPWGHLLGYSYFYKRPYFLHQSTLDPRYDSEGLVSLVLQHFSSPKKHKECHKNLFCKKSYKFLDLGTGSGCLLLSLLRHFPTSLGIGVDISSGALAMAHHNARYQDQWFSSDQEPLNSRVFWTKGSWFQGLKKHHPSLKFSCIVANPPYIEPYLQPIVKTYDDHGKQYSREESLSTPLLGPEVLKWDPPKALFGGLKPYEHILSQASLFLESEGYCIVEIGWDQQKEVMNLFEKNDFHHVQSHQDHQGFWRFVSGIYKKI